MIDKQEILKTIRRLSVENGGTAPGRQVFSRETGVRMSDWYPHIWLRWGDALTEAGFAPKEFQSKTSDADLLESYMGLVRELGRLPVEGELRRKARADKSFPSHTSFNRFGGKANLVETIIAHCKNVPGFEDVLAVCTENENTSPTTTGELGKRGRSVATGFVYLMKSGPHYKIGFTSSLGRRGSELAIQVPIPPKTVHSIETDDPVGIEAYWHGRFKDKRRGGTGTRNSEWFDLSTEDVSAFKRWKRIL